MHYKGMVKSGCQSYTLLMLCMTNWFIVASHWGWKMWKVLRWNFNIMVYPWLATVSPSTLHQQQISLRVTTPNHHLNTLEMLMALLSPPWLWWGNWQFTWMPNWGVFFVNFSGFIHIYRHVLQRLWSTTYWVTQSLIYIRSDTYSGRFY